MSLFDILKHKVTTAVQSSVKKAVTNAGNKSETFTFSTLPKTVEELKALSEASLDTPFKTAALTVLALVAFAESRDNGIQMLNFLKGPQPLSTYEIQFMKDRMLDGKSYIPRSYLLGATPQNNYTPSTPYKLTLSTNPYSYDQEGYVVLWIKSGGADNARQIKMRRKGEQWFLWEQFLLPDIRKPASEDPWA